MYISGAIAVVAVVCVIDIANISNVAVVPGEDFGECARNHIRLSFACSQAQIEKGVARIDAFARSLVQVEAASRS